MSSSFAKIAFTPAVKALQELQGSRELYAGFEMEADQTDELSIREIEYIESRDSFYQATVSDTGWPYVQHRGGPKGFLKVLDNNNLAFADFRGNRQYVSTGNLLKNDRIAMILVDYEKRRRLKIFGHVRLVLAIDEPELLARLIAPEYPAHVEHALVIRVEALSWNCSKHIATRYKQNEFQATQDR